MSRSIVRRLGRSPLSSTDSRQRDARLLFGDPIYSGHGYPPRPGEDRPGLSPFGRLAMNQTLGKPSILFFDADNPKAQASEVDIITIEGDDLDAWQIVVTLHPPRVIPLPFHVIRERMDKQNLTGEETNSQVTTGEFPGTEDPISWPPLEAVVEFGTGGTSMRFEADYINGCTFSVVASYLRVHAKIAQNTPDGSIITGTSAAYYLSAHAGPGFAVPHLQKTVFVGEVADSTDSDVFDIPKQAKLVQPFGHVLSGTPQIATGFFRFWQDPKGTVPVGDPFFSANQQVPIEIPNSAMYFSIFSQAGIPMKFGAIFKLAL